MTTITTKAPSARSITTPRSYQQTPSDAAAAGRVQLEPGTGNRHRARGDRIGLEAHFSTSRADPAIARTS
jgi:hypothetical protein